MSLVPFNENFQFRALWVLGRMCFLLVWVACRDVYTTGIAHVGVVFTTTRSEIMSGSILLSVFPRWHCWGQYLLLGQFHRVHSRHLCDARSKACVTDLDFASLVTTRPESDRVCVNPNRHV